MAFAQDIDIGGGFAIKEDGKGVGGTYKHSDFEVTLTCVRELNGTDVVKEAKLDTATVTSTRNQGDDGTGLVIERTLTWNDPAEAAGSLTWVHKLWAVQATIESVEGANDSVSVEAGDLKGKFTFEWTPEDYDNQLQICAHVNWDIAERDIVETVIGAGGIPELDYNEIKDEDGNSIGFEITGDFHFKFYWPGKVRYEQQLNNTYTLGAAAVTTENLDKNLQGSVDVIVTFDSIGDRVIIDPVTALGDASTLMHAAVLLLAVLSLLLSIFA